MKAQQIFTRNEVIKVIEELLQYGDSLMDAITSEDPENDAEDLLDMAEDSLDVSTIDNTGASLIAIERQEQIEKHGFQIQHDEEYIDEELVMAAQASIIGNAQSFPNSWRQSPFVDKICAKNKRVNKYIITKLK